MIASLRGILQEKSQERVVLDVQGVGYSLRVPLSTYGTLPSFGQEVQLLVHTHVREDAILLFGFASQRERLLFERMIGVNGVGPRIAIALLSGIPPDDLLCAIRSGDASRLCQVPGVGRKTAERIVVDLRDKLPPPEGEETPAVGQGGRGGDSEEAVLADVLSALINLGYAAKDARRAVVSARAVPGREGSAPSSFERLLRDALRSVAPPR